MSYDNHQYFQSMAGNDEITTATAGDKAFITPSSPIKVIRWGYIVTTVLGNANLVAALYYRPTAGSDTDRVNAWGGTITPGAATAVGKGVQHTLTTGEGDRTSPIPEAVIVPGEELVIEVTTTASSGAVYWFVEYQPLSNSEYSYLTTGSSGNMTEKAS